MCFQTHVYLIPVFPHIFLYHCSVFTSFSMLFICLLTLSYLLILFFFQIFCYFSIDTPFLMSLLCFHNFSFVIFCVFTLYLISYQYFHFLFYVIPVFQQLFCTYSLCLSTISSVIHVFLLLTYIIFCVPPPFSILALCFSTLFPLPFHTFSNKIPMFLHHLIRHTCASTQFAMLFLCFCSHFNTIPVFSHPH